LSNYIPINLLPLRNDLPLVIYQHVRVRVRVRIPNTD
jgi:hypothetical protein